MISVAMAVYNGEKYIKEQICSILAQLSKDDELVISYDDSCDNTLNIINGLRGNDSRIRLINGPNKGLIKNFENAIVNCSNEYIFLSDQDDVWCENKVSEVMSIFEKSDVDLVLHDAKVVDENLNVLFPSFFERRNSKKGLFNNVIKNSYIGCCMAFKASLKNKILPFPEKIPMHDQWIGLIAGKYGKVEFLNKTLLLYRRHDETITKGKRADVITMLKWRARILNELFKRSKNL